jgi:hypothetical protein
MCENGEYVCDVGGTKSCKDCSGGACQQCSVTCDRSQQTTGDNDEDGIDNECDTENNLQDCNDVYDNDGDGLCNDEGCGNQAADPGCAEVCTSCQECGAGFLNFCSQTECEQSCGSDCHYDAGMLGIANGCCPDSDRDDVCDADDACPNFNDSINADGDIYPDACDTYPYDFDNDDSPDAKDCWEQDDSKKEGDLCGDLKFCGTDGCVNGIYQDYTDCDNLCTDKQCDCDCAPPVLPYFDSDGDSYDDGCDINITDPCSKQTKEDNCGTVECEIGTDIFCEVCGGDDDDGDGVINDCDSYPGDPCSIESLEDNCGGSSCAFKSPVYCHNCSGNDADGDGSIDVCDTENSLEDCNDGFDNNGDGYCDDFGCVCEDSNSFCGTGDTSIGFLEAEVACANKCTQCSECGAGAFNFCEEVECNGCGIDCTFKPGIRFFLGIGNDCCPDSDQDGLCDDEDMCEGHDDNIDTDGDGMPDACDTCITEPAITIEALEPTEVTCADGIDNDCDLLRDIDDEDCQCGEGTARCDDGTCEAWCGAFYPCISDGLCNKNESCDCADCAFERGSCEQGYACNPSVELCTNEPDLSPELCEYADPLTMQSACDVGETNCWVASIPSDVTIIGDVRCCGDDPMETWSYEANTFIEDVIVEYTCYDGVWVRVGESGVTLFDIGLG